MMMAVNAVRFSAWLSWTRLFFTELEHFRKLLMLTYITFTTFHHIQEEQGVMATRGYEDGVRYLSSFGQPRRPARQYPITFPPIAALFPLVPQRQKQGQNQPANRFKPVLSLSTPVSHP